MCFLAREPVLEALLALPTLLTLVSRSPLLLVRFLFMEASLCSGSTLRLRLDLVLRPTGLCESLDDFGGEDAWLRAADERAVLRGAILAFCWLQCVFQWLATISGLIHRSSGRRAAARVC